MSLIYREQSRFDIREINNESIKWCLDAVLNIIVRLIDVGNQKVIQLIDQKGELTSNVKKVVEFLDINETIFKNLIQDTIVKSQFGYYNTFQAFMLCRIIRDYSTINESFSSIERLEYIRSGEEIIYYQMKQIREHLLQNKFDNIEHTGYILDQIQNDFCRSECNVNIPGQIICGSLLRLDQIVSYPGILGQVYDSYIKYNLRAFLDDKLHLQFVQKNNSLGKIEILIHSYALEISERNGVILELKYQDKNIFLKDIILCDFIPCYEELRILSVDTKNLILSTQVVDEQVIDNYYTSLNYILIPNIPLKYIREISFLYGIQVFNSQNQLGDFQKVSQIENKYTLQVLDKHNLNFNRNESELFHLNQRITAILQPTPQVLSNILCYPCNISMPTSILSVVLIIPSSLQHKQLMISLEIMKQFQKLRSIILNKKIIRGTGEFERRLSDSIKIHAHNNPYLTVFAHALHDYYTYIQKYIKMHPDEFEIIFYDDYRAKKDILSKINSILKIHQLTQLELTFELQKK